MKHQSCYMDKLLAENAKIQHILNTFSPLQNPNRWYIRNVKSTEKKEINSKMMKKEEWMQNLTNLRTTNLHMHKKFLTLFNE